ncbi:MAG: metallophosphoesterase [Pseudomonadota bacterium]
MGKKICISVLFLISAIGIYSFFVEPRWLEATHHQIQGRVESPIKIAHLTDLHFGNLFRLEKDVLTEIKKEQPDIIFITGDLYEDLNQLEEMTNFFTQLRAPLGVWGVKGNWENWVPVSDEHSFWETLGVNLLTNQKMTIREDIELFGYDDESSGRPDRNLASKETDKFRICLFHSPSFFEKASANCSLSLSGHTHGGQIKIPFWGPLWLPKGSTPFLGGWYHLEESHMYVSRGLGTSVLPLRFGSRPELSFITVSR